LRNTPKGGFRSITPEFRQQITEILHDALEHDIKGREAYLQEACWHDSALRILYLNRKSARLSVEILPRSRHRPRASTEGSVVCKVNKTGVRLWGWWSSRETPWHCPIGPGAPRYRGSRTWTVSRAMPTNAIGNLGR
jgi:hypothetical protein